MDTTEQSNNICPDGHVNPPGQHFCGECGKPLISSEPATPSDDMPAASDAADDASDVPTARRFLRPAVLVPIAVLAALAVGGLTYLLTRDSSPETHTVAGVLTLTDTDEYWSDGDPCEGSGGYDDIREGAQVTIKDENGHVLATGDLLEGLASGDYDCDFAFVLDDVPDAKFYAVEVSHRGEITSSRQEMEDNGWIVGLSLGD